MCPREIKLTNKEKEIVNKKSLFIAYFLWLFGGVFGAHHFYLQRDRHAFIWFCTLGGYFGIGWIYEIFKIFNYVQEANEDKKFVENFKIKLKKFSKPPFSTVRFVGEIMVGYLYGELIKQAIPENIILGVNWHFLHWFIPLGIALGIWTVGNIGREKGVLWHCLIAAYFCYPIRHFIYDESWALIIVLFFTALIFDIFSKEWRKEPIGKVKLCKRLTILFLAVIIYVTLWGSYFYFNGTILNNEGDEILVSEAIKNFSTVLWTDFADILYEIYVYSKSQGFREILKQFYRLIQEESTQNCYKVLNLTPGASQLDITIAWRRLSREYHPDKQKDTAKRKEAQIRFMEIQHAYELLSKNKIKRKNRNKKFNDEF